MGATRKEIVTGEVAQIAMSKLVRAATELGLPEDALTGSAPALAPMSFVPLEDLVRAWEIVMRRARQPALPVTLSAEFTPEDFELVGFLAAASRTLGEAIDVLTLHINLWIRGITWDVSGDATVCMRYVFPASHKRLGVCCATESALTQLVQVARLLTRKRVAPLLVRFSHLEPADVTAHRDFFGCPVVFGCADDAVVVERSVLDTPIPSAQPGLRLFLEEQARLRRATEPVRRTIASRVREWLALQDGPISQIAADQIAQHLHWSERSLRRHLDLEGTSLSALIDEALEKRACVALRGGASVDDVASGLGFASRSAFARAFRRWTGQSPREYRAQR